MRVRELQKKDVVRMLEWMHDERVTEFMKTNFRDKTIEDCECFVLASKDDKENIHLAIVDDTDMYMGTVSLKNITNNNAEFAITVHKDAMGKGYAKWAMEQMIQMGFDKYLLEEIYWYVDKKNERALRFYDKNSYRRVTVDNIHGMNMEGKTDYIWYQIKR